MLKMILVLLLAMNAALAALNAGYLEPWIASGHEPQRLQQQISPEKIRQLNSSAASVSAPVSVAATAAVVSVPAAVACFELGDFSLAEATRLETAFGKIVTADRVARRRVSEPSSFMVYIASQGDKEGAERKAGELRRLGISDFYVLQTEGEMRYGISLGIFKTKVAAEGHLAELVKKGVRSARITGRGDNPTKLALQLRGLDDQAVAAVVKIAKTEPRDCAQL